MKNNSGLVLIIIVVILIMAGGLYFVLAPKASAPVTISTSAHTLSVGANSVNYSCKVGTLEATYINNSVQLALSDGRDMTLPQVMSGSGIKYESIAVPGSAGTDIIFSSKGNDAFLTENGKITYDNCVAGTNTSSSTSTNGTQTFTDQGKTFSRICCIRGRSWLLAGLDAKHNYTRTPSREGNTTKYI
jgi:membrane-bound inhibitor of C-type lysozyme